MKKLIGSLFLGSLMLMSCSSEPKKQVEKPAAKTEVSAVEQGKKFFSDNGCVACHQEQQKVIGPALKDIAAKYNETGNDMVVFLKGEGTAIVDTDPAQVAVMQANFAVTKALPESTLKALEAYIKSVK
ncbi:MAG: c-type cytochrome [Flavobacteriaceae bacterium]